MQISRVSRTMMIVIGLCASVDAWAIDSGTAKFIQGEVHVERGGNSIPLRVGDAIQELDRIVVGATGSAGLTLKDETLISLGPNSTLVIDRFAFDSKTNQGRVETSLLRGAMRYVTGLIARLNPRSAIVNTRNITIGVRGTEFIVEAAGAN